MVTAMKKTPWSTKLRSVRKRLGLKQREAAERCGIPYRTWIGWEVGNHTPSKIVRDFVLSKLT